MNATISGSTRLFVCLFVFFLAASRGKNAILRLQKSKNLPKMADFGHFFLLTGEKVGGQSLRLWGKCPL